MDSTANIESNSINIKSFVTEKIQIFELVLNELETISKKSKDYFVKVLTKNNRIDNNLLESYQFESHGYACFETYRIGLRETFNWFVRLRDSNKAAYIDYNILVYSFAEYLSQMRDGIMISQTEMVRPTDIGLNRDDFRFADEPEVNELISLGLSNDLKKEVVNSLENGIFPNLGLNDETLEMIQDQFRKFTEEEIIPHANEWHLKDDLIPDQTLAKMAELGVFSIAIPENYGGLGMGKIAMCVVTEELSRGFLAAGSLGTRAEIAGELIRLGGTEDQKNKYLPEIANGNILTTAVFTEPNTGSDLGSLATRATLNGSDYTITGNKTWITHGARSDLMTVLARTDLDQKGYKGLSMFLVEKPRGNCENPFPMNGMSGSEIEVLGYRGMKEYEIALDDIKVNKKQLLGEEEGNGFKQLMETFESARIQTAARAVGVAQNALELALQYAKDRSQFGKQIIKFPRILNKLAWMVMEITVSRQITLFSAREKDNDIRCDIEAGMAKLLAARVAWSTADSALQIHGGNGYALEYPVSRVLCDSRILNIFEGAAEIQAQIVAKGLIGR
jgi:(2S)-methylsuccinyl-CoA dehydrogenase